MKYFKFVLLAAVMFGTSVSFAQIGSADKSFADLMPNIFNQMGFLKLFFIAAFSLAGLWYAGTGVKGFIDANDPTRKQEVKPGQAATRLLGGVGLMSIGFVILVMTNSTLGESEEVDAKFYGEQYR